MKTRLDVIILLIGDLMKIIRAIILTLMILGLSLTSSPASTKSGEVDTNQGVTNLYVATTNSLCGSYTPCYPNSAVDEANGVGTGLRDAIDYARDEGLTDVVINILPPYELKSNAVSINYPVTINGLNGGWISNASTSCDQPMLSIETAATIRNIELADQCDSSPVDLIAINSPGDVIIEHSTLRNGANAIRMQGNTGNILIQFNQIDSNASYAVLRDSQPVNTGRLDIIGNNIQGNSASLQVECASSALGSVDHNYWGDGVLPEQVTSNCAAANAKRLGAPVLASVSPSRGVQGERLVLSTGYAEPVLGGFRARSASAGTVLYAINHGSVMPFPSLATPEPTVCSNYYDVFLGAGEMPADLTLSFSYTQACKAVIESSAHCASGDSTRYPLMWLDTQFGITGGWDNVGAPPQGPGGAIYPGQEVTCNSGTNSIDVVIDNLGRPNLEHDLFFTPFVIAGVTFGPTPTSTNTPTRTSTSTKTLVPTNTFAYHSPTPFRTATSAFITPQPGETQEALALTLTAAVTPTLDPTDISTSTPTYTSTVYQTSTPTPKTNATREAVDLVNTDRYGRESWWGIPLGVAGALVVILLLGAFVYRRH